MPTQTRLMAWLKPKAARSCTSSTTPLGGMLPVDQVVDGIRGRLACRGERAYLARVQPGRIRVAPVAFEDISVEWTEYTPDSVEGRSATYPTS